MSISKVLCTALATVAVGSVMADMTNLVIPYSSTGDTYGDGVGVLDNEWYALCWSSSDTFAGLDANLAPVASGDEMIIARPLALNGGCRSVFFNVNPVGANDNDRSSGNFFVVMLDTRNGATTLDATTKVVSGKTVPATVNGSAAAVKIDLDGAQYATSSSGTVGTESTFVAATSDDMTPAKIAGIEIVNGQAVVTVENMNPYISYTLKTGASVDSLSTATIAPKKGSFAKEKADTFEFVLEDGEDAKFFQLQRAE